MTAPAALCHVEFATSDQATAREFIDQAYGGRLALSAGRQSDWRVSVSKTDAADFSMADITLPADLTFKIAGRAEFVVNTLLTGTITHDHAHDRASERYRPGDVYLAAQPGAEIISQTHDAGMYTVSLRASLLAEVAAAAPGEAAPVEFASWRPLDGGAQRWAEASRFVQRLLADPDKSTAPLLIGPAARLLAAAALTAFPNTTVTDLTAADRRDAHGGTVRRAVSFIDANADRDITAGDIAAAAYVTVRALQLAFRRHLGTTPMGYLRRVRLDRARQDLRSVGRDEGLTVTAVAYRWGFSSPSRFAEHYRAAYRELPSETLLR